MPGKFKAILRIIREDLLKNIEKRQSLFLLGPRQVGKTTLIRDLLSDREDVFDLPLQDPNIRLAYEKDPGLLVRQIRAAKKPPTVFIDEVQKVPELLDAAQLLIDERKANFILTGSSARKLKKAGTNLLPGRVKTFHLDPLSWSELGWIRENRVEELAIAFDGDATGGEYSIEKSMTFGSLPGIMKMEEDGDRKDFLHAYANLYLEEEIRAEALTRKIGAFSRFLELAAQESGTSPNLSKLSMESGVSVPTVKEYYAILQETLVMERVDPYLKNARKRILATPRYYFFDIGVRNALARLPLEPSIVQAQKGTLFEHAVILEIIRRIRAMRKEYRVCFWRTAGGAEVDCIVDMGDQVIPIEIKSSASIRIGELKGLSGFLAEYPKAAKHGYVVTMGAHPERVSDNITAIPWTHL